MLLALVPVLWFGGDWWGSGDPLGGGERAEVVAEGTNRVGLALRRAAGSVMVPVWLAAAGAVVVAWRRRDRVLLWLAGGAMTWMAVVVATTILFGYAALSRFMLPAVAVICVLAGIGVSRLATALEGRRPRVAVAAALLLVLASAPFAAPRVAALGQQARDARTFTAVQDDLDVALARAGGADELVRCGGDFGIDLTFVSVQTALAWKVDVPLIDVGYDFEERSGVIFTRRRDARDRFLSSVPPPVVRPLARTGGWAVFAVRCSDG